MRQSRNVIWDMINTFAVEHTFVILLNFFEEQSTQNHPQYLSGLSRALFPTTFLEIAVYITSDSVTYSRSRRSISSNRFYA